MEWVRWPHLFVSQMDSSLPRIRYVEWEDYPDKKVIARYILNKHKFSLPPGESARDVHLITL